MKNIWFDGGGYACAWSFGVSEILKESNIKFDLIGGYSAGAMIAAWMLKTDACPDKIFNSIYEAPYGPSKGTFALIGKHHLNLKYITETILGDPTELNLEQYNNKLWIPIQQINKLTVSWRNSFKDYDDIVDCIISTQCIPYIAHENFFKCWYDNSHTTRGLTVDGGIFSKSFPKNWNKNETIRISPWGSEDINMIPSAKITDILFPNFDDLVRFRFLGRRQGKEFINNYK